MQGILSTRCSTCHTYMTWKKVHFMREDLYPDWSLAVFCDCGIVTDPEIRKAARADYDQQNANAIYAEQEANLKKSCPKWAEEIAHTEHAEIAEKKNIKNSVSADQQIGPFVGSSEQSEANQRRSLAGERRY